MNDVVRVAVVGGGLIAQAVHLPNVVALPERFALAAIADPSAKVREALGALYAPARPYEDWRTMVEREELDAVIVCSPRSTHAAVIAAALDRGLHVFVEKPLCIAVEDADAICARAASAGRVVQVGYMKRFAGAYGSFLEHLPSSADGLRLIDVLTYDPWMAREPFVPWSRMVPADDVPAAVRAAAAEEEREQVARAVGRDDPDSVRSYSDTFLACLIHDVNLVHGALDRLGLSGRASARASAAWAGGDAASVSLALPGGVVWRSSWLLLRGLNDFEERVRLFFDDAIHELEFSVPYHVDAPAHHRITDGRETRARAFVDDPYRAELEHFHACITAGEPCRTPPEQAREDIAVLRELFLRRDQPEASP
jgi:predicted dehydrogenase